MTDFREAIEAMRKVNPDVDESDLFHFKELELKEALRARNWPDIQRIEKEIEELQKQGFDKLNDKERIMTESQKLRYSLFLKNASPEKVRNVREMLEIIECIKDVYSKLPTGSPDFELIKQALLQKALAEGCSMEDLEAFQEYINAVYDNEMSIRKKKKR